ncbi:TPA: imidazole glycerol phosphate synthase subunit HisF [Candidatus Woesearchaeota archaeon]|nr:imidazole glycerol phosphate synthase subunit HisF [Candidatus Woesearchaeota archaeon]HIH49034.1 imidazole glycerol phosphate synthase subunit HisF [Candidatus Woesearchaeota archaeon]HIJ03037.1 imidazole glycerol phosphate synthase subunit HisF [Candidatus Woesearchaeota archaeon]
MITKRIIPCLDVKEGRVVKGTGFINLKDAGDPVLLAKMYNDQGADELVFLDITASAEKRKTMVGVVRAVAKEVFIPLTVGGGVETVDDIRVLLQAGADKVSLNTAAVLNPDIISKAAEQFGRQCVVVAIDAKRKGSLWEVIVRGGRERTGKDAIAWAKEAASLGAGELLVTSMDQDGTKAGYDLELTKTIAASVNIPIIASGGAGTLVSIKDVFLEGNADAALIASLLHYGTFTTNDVKTYLKKERISVRL